MCLHFSEAPKETLLARQATGRRGGGGICCSLEWLLGANTCQSYWHHQNWLTLCFFPLWCKWNIPLGYFPLWYFFFYVFELLTILLLCTLAFLTVLSSYLFLQQFEWRIYSCTLSQLGPKSLRQLNPCERCGEREQERDGYMIFLENESDLWLEKLDLQREMV